eukprot:s141_g23.t1
MQWIASARESQKIIRFVSPSKFQTMAEASSSSNGSASSDGSGSDPVDFTLMAQYYRLPCNQCLFFTSASGCKQGNACAFCHHLVAPGQTGLSRPRRGRRDAVRRRVWSLLKQLDVEKQEPQAIVYQLQIESQWTEYRRIITQSAVDSLLQQVENERRARGEPLPRRVTQRSCGALDCFSV